MDAEPQTHRVCGSTYDHFRACVLGLYSGHQSRPPFGGKSIYHDLLRGNGLHACSSRAADLRHDRCGQNGRHAITDHPETMPNCRMEHVAIRKPLQTSGLPYCYHTRLIWVDGTNGLIRSQITPRAGAKRRALPIPCKFRVAPDAIDFAGRELREPSAHRVAMLCLPMTGKLARDSPQPLCVK